VGRGIETAGRRKKTGGEAEVGELSPYLFYARRPKLSHGEREQNRKAASKRCGEQEPSNESGGFSATQIVDAGENRKDERGRSRRGSAQTKGN